MISSHKKATKTAHSLKEWQSTREEKKRKKQQISHSGYKPMKTSHIYKHTNTHHPLIGLINVIASIRSIEWCWPIEKTIMLILNFYMNGKSQQDKHPKCIIKVRKVPCLMKLTDLLEQRLSMKNKWQIPSEFLWREMTKQWWQTNHCRVNRLDSRFDIELCMCVVRNVQSINITFYFTLYFRKNPLNFLLSTMVGLLIP